MLTDENGEQSIINDLAGKPGISSNAISVVEAQYVVWNDGSLGCPKPGEFYTQATVNGYRVVLQAGGKQYDYRASEKGYFSLCEMPMPPGQPPVGTPSS